MLVLLNIRQGIQAALKLRKSNLIEHRQSQCIALR